MNHHTLLLIFCYFEKLVLTMFEYTAVFFIAVLLKTVRYENQNEISVLFWGDFSKLRLKDFLTLKVNLKYYYMKLGSETV